MGQGCTKGKNDPTAEYCRAMFTFERIVGKGGFGRVWRVRDKKKKEVYALKVIDKARVISKKSVQSVLNEREILSSLVEQNCKFVVNMHCSFQDRDNLYLLMDYLEAGDLRYYINRGMIFNEEQIKFLVRCLMEGLKCLHRRNIIHRDIKPENIIIDAQGYARITDLGIARYWKTENSYETSGTPGYMAPQVLLRQNHSFSVDFYAVGVIAYELLVGKRPYAGRDRKTIREEMLAREPKIPAYIGHYTENCKNFVNGLLSRTSRKRLGYNGISQIINHPWLQNTPQFYQLFLKQEIQSPIDPIEVIQSTNLQQNTEPDEVWRENKLHLKRKDIQMLFDGYDYSAEHTQELKARSDANSTLPTIIGKNS